MSATEPQSSCEYDEKPDVLDCLTPEFPHNPGELLGNISLDLLQRCDCDEVAVVPVSGGSPLLRMGIVHGGSNLPS